MSESTKGAVQSNTAMVQDLLKLRCRLFALLQRQMCLAAHIHRIQRTADLKLWQRRTQLVLRRSLQKLQGFRRVVVAHFNRGVYGRQPIPVDRCVEREAVS